MNRLLLVLLFPLCLFGQTRAVINTGTTANDGTGDSLRTFGLKSNTNFSTLWASVYTNGVTKIGTNIVLSGSVVLDGNLTNSFDFDDINQLNLDGINTEIGGVRTLFIDGGITTLRGFTNLNLITPGVTAATATAGQALVLSDATEGTVEFSSVATPTYVSSAIGSTNAPVMSVWDDGTYLNARMAFDSTRDLWVQFARSLSTSLNRNANFTGIFLINSSEWLGSTNGYIVLTSGANDDFGPINLNGRGNVSGNHTHEGLLLTKAAHGITSADVGKRWVDAGGQNWRLLSVPSSSTLYFFAQANPTTGHTRVGMSTSGTLTSLDGSSNVATPFTAASVSQSGQYMTDPAGRGIRDRVLTVLVDGVPLGSPGFAHSVSELTIRDDYLIPDHAFIYDQFTTTTNKISDVTPGVGISREFRLHPHGQLEFRHFIRFLGPKQELNADTLQQANPLSFTAPYTQLWRWAPGATGPTTNNLNVPSLHTTAPSGAPKWLFPTHAVDTNRCPDAFYSFLSTNSASLSAGDCLIGQLIAYDPEVYEASAAYRKTNMTTASSSYGFYRIEATNKEYPNSSVTSSNTDTNRPVRVSGTRQWFAPQSSGPIAVTWTKSAGDRWIIRAAWQSNLGSSSFSIPLWLGGRTLTTHYAYNGSTTSTSTTGGTISLTTTSGPGQIILIAGPRNN
jgi:hypothetical protein